MKIVILGGAGAMGSITARDLREFADSTDTVIVADFDQAKAEQLIERFSEKFSEKTKSKKKSPAQFVAAFCDAKNPESLASVLAGTDVVINCLQYSFNLDVMQAALKARVHYIDLGGLFHMTRKQLELNSAFEEAGLMALVGMGAAPGITNILSRMGADELDTVTEIHTRVAGVDKTKYAFTPALPVSYSLQTILEEFSFEPAVFTKGKFTFVKPMSGAVAHRFPHPIGLKKPMYTIHSEVATLPMSFASKGVREVSFKIAFSDTFVERVRFLRDMGLASQSPVLVAGVKVKPIELVNKVAMSQEQPVAQGASNQHEIVRAVVKGLRKKKKVTYIYDCYTQGMPEWNIGTDINTGTPPAIAALMMKRGEIKFSGVCPAEIAVPPQSFVQELKLRKMFVKKMTQPGWTMHC